MEVELNLKRIKNLMLDEMRCAVDEIEDFENGKIEEDYHKRYIKEYQSQLQGFFMYASAGIVYFYDPGSDDEEMDEFMDYMNGAADAMTFDEFVALIKEIYEKYGNE